MADSRPAPEIPGMTNTFNYIYLYHIDEVFNIPVTPDEVANSYQSRFTTSDVMNRTSPKMTYTGSGPRTVSVSLQIHSQLYELDNNSETSDSGEKKTVLDLIKALSAAAYPRFEESTNKVIPPMVLLQFGETCIIRGIINGNVNVSWSGPWLKNGLRAMVAVQFTVTEIDQFSADYIRQFGSTPQIPFDLNRTDTQ